MVRALFGIVIALTAVASSAASDYPAERFIQAKLGEKWGLLDQSGKAVLPFIYDFISVDDGGDITLTVDKMSGKADGEGRIFIPVSYESVGVFHSDGYASAATGGRYGLIDRNNRWALPAIFSAIDRFDDGDLYAARYKGKYGVLSLADRKWVIPPTFFYIGHLAKNGLASAKTDLNHAGFIRKDGSWVIPAGRFEEQWEFGNEGLAAARIGKKWGFIDASGNWVIQPISEDIIWPDDFNDSGTTFVKVGGKFHLMNRAGKFIRSTAYEEIRRFKDGYAQVMLGGRWGLVDEAGKTVVTPAFDGFTDFHREGLAAAFQGNRSWIIDRQGRRQFGTRFDRVGGFFGGGWAAASRAGKWGAIDPRGKWLVAAKYDCVSICFDEPPPKVILTPMSAD